MSIKRECCSTIFRGQIGVKVGPKVQILGTSCDRKNLTLRKSFTWLLQSYDDYLWPKFQLNLTLFNELLPPNLLKWVQLVYETKNMMGLFWVKSKTTSSQAMKLGMFKLWKNPDPNRLCKSFCWPFDPARRCTSWSKTPSALILPVVKISSKLDCI